MMLLASVPSATGRLRLRRQPMPLPIAESSEMPLMGHPAFPASMLAFGGVAINPVSTEELESMPNPADIANVNLGAATVDRGIREYAKSS